MDTPHLVDALLTGGVYVVILAVMYLVILTYRLPYAQVLLAYVVLKLLEAIYTNVIRHRIIAGDNRPMPGYGMALGITDIVLLFAAFIGVPIIASYRFSALQVGGVFATGFAAGTVANLITRRM